MIDFIIRKYDKYKIVSLKEGNTEIDLGLLSNEEVDELVSELLAAITELRS